MFILTSGDVMWMTRSPLLKMGSVEYLLSVLNNFHPKIKFTYKMEVESKLAFLDILLHRDGQDIITTVYRKVTNNDVYLNWHSFCPRQWKRGTFRSLVQQAYIICFIIASTERRIKTFRKCFCYEKQLSYMGS